MQIHASIFYSLFISHHSALSEGLSFQIKSQELCHVCGNHREWERKYEKTSWIPLLTLISTLGTKHKLRVIITSAQVPNTQQRWQKGHCVCGCTLSYQIQMLKFAANMGPLPMTRTSSMGGWKFGNCSNVSLILCFWRSREPQEVNMGDAKFAHGLALGRPVSNPGSIA